MIRTVRLGACATLLSVAASAQVLPVANETFQYPTTGAFGGGSAGAGFVNNWWVSGGNTDLALFDATATPPFSGSDGVGLYVGQVNAGGAAYRRVDGAQHLDISDASGNIGIDGATVWISVSMVHFRGGAGVHWGGLSLFGSGAEVMFIGTPYGANEWGISDYGTPNAGVVTVAGSDDAVAARLVIRFDHMAGPDRLRLWVDPPVAHPTTSANVDVLVGDLQWDEIRLASGGNNNDGCYFDNVVVEKGEPTTSVGTNYCGPAVVNSSGASAVMGALGQTLASANQISLEVSDVPANTFGFFLVSQVQGFMPNPGGSAGNVCLGGSIGRYNEASQILNSTSAAHFSLPLDLTRTPVGSTFAAVQAGETWNYQCWFRDVVGGTASSNFTDGLQIDFN